MRLLARNGFGGGGCVERLPCRRSYFRSQLEVPLDVQMVLVGGVALKGDAMALDEQCSCEKDEVMAYGDERSCALQCWSDGA